MRVADELTDFFCAMLRSLLVRPWPHQIDLSQSAKHRANSLSTLAGDPELGCTSCFKCNRRRGGRRCCRYCCCLAMIYSRRAFLIMLVLFLLLINMLYLVLSKSLDFPHRLEHNELLVTPKDFFMGPCLVNTNQTCPDPEVSFFLYTRINAARGHEIIVTDSGSNLNETHFDPSDPTKIIVHGYNSDMELDSLVDMRIEYLARGPHNVVAVDWHRLAAGPCYPVAVHNVPHVGGCLAQLIERLRAAGSEDLHVIGFSLGAHVPAFTANHLVPYKLPRITGLDPAMPLFVTVSKHDKLDADDALFVDVLHTNAFVQGKVEPSGHLDFYMNGGVNQPGCWEKRNPFGCSHHRAAEYFAESINSQVGFWGWPCPGFLAYLLGFCSPRYPAILAGELVDKTRRGFFLVKTKNASPFAEGPFQVNISSSTTIAAPVVVPA